MLNQIAEDKSLGGNLWKVSSVDERAAELMVQKCNLPYIVHFNSLLRETIYEGGIISNTR